MLCTSTLCVHIFQRWAVGEQVRELRPVNPTCATDRLWLLRFGHLGPRSVWLLALQTAVLLLA